MMSVKESVSVFLLFGKVFSFSVTDPICLRYRRRFHYATDAQGTGEAAAACGRKSGSQDIRGAFAGTVIKGNICCKNGKYLTGDLLHAIVV